MGSVTNVIYPGSSNVYAYNATQQLTNMVDLTGINPFTYENGFLIEEDGPWASDAIHLGYMHGVRTNLTLKRPSGADWSQTYTYDPTLRLTALASGAGTFTYSFRGPGNLITNLALPNGATITNSYDSGARWTGTYLKNSAVNGVNPYIQFILCFAFIFQRTFGSTGSPGRCIRTRPRFLTFTPGWT